jgi:hypothetical protein
MNTIRKTLMVILPLALLAGCEALPAQGETDTVAQKQEGTFTFDTTAIARPPSGGIPTDQLTTSSFDDAVIGRSLIETGESFEPGMRLGEVNEMVAKSWKFEKALGDGVLLVLKTAAPGEPLPVVDEAVLQRSATARLGAWGIPASEIGRVLQLRTLAQDADGTAVDKERVFRYKTFVFRAINGVPVEGHRAVVTHGLDGSFGRALIKWPAFAAKGHLLHSRLGVPEIQERAIAALKAEGETAGAVRLRYKYVPTKLTTGEVTLTLKVGARLLPDRTSANTEAREIDVDVDANP